MIKTGVTGHVDNILTHIVINNIRQKFSQCIPIKTKDPWFFNVFKEYRKGTLA